MEGLGPIEQNVKISQKIVERIKEMILSGRLQPGEVLPKEHDLAKTMKVSRPTLREALTVLEAMGLIEVRRRTGSIVKSPVPQGFQEPIQDMILVDPLQVLNLFEVREKVESEGAAMAAERATDVELEKVKSCANELEKILEGKKSILEVEPARAYRKTVFAIADATGNPIWAHFTKSIWTLLQDAIPFSRQRLLEIPNASEALYQQYREIVRYVTERKAEEARTAVIRHISFQREQLRKMLESVTNESS